MATYKVIQDIEAEDKLLGPLTLKGFIYAAIAAILAYINFRIMMATGLGTLRWVVVLVLALPMLLFGLLAAPIGRDQPTEVWLLSRIRFFLKPRKRIWNQSGISHLVTITVPKKPEKQLTKNLSQSEVNSRLKALAMTLDSRGWAVKNVEPEDQPVPLYLQGLQADSDRLVGVSALSRPQQVMDLHASDDILDEQNNKTAQNFHNLMQKADADRKKEVKEVISKFNAARDGKTDEDDDKSPDFSSDFYKADENADKLKDRDAKHSPKTKAAPVTPDNQTAKMELAQSGNAFKISTLSQMANRESKVRQIGPGEIEISLH